MDIINLLRRKEFYKLHLAGLVAILSGGANVILLVAICDALRFIADADRTLYVLVIFLIAGAALWVSQRLLMRLVTVHFSNAIDQLRASMLRRAFAADYLEITEIGGHHLAGTLSRTYDIILEAAPALVVCTHCTVEIIFGGIFLLGESAQSVAITFPLILAGGTLIVITGLKLNTLRNKLQEQNAQLENHTLLIAESVRESRINSWKAYRTYNIFMENAEKVRLCRVKSNDMFIMNFAFAELVYFAIGGTVAFLFPKLVTLSQIDLIFVANAASFMAYPALLIALFSLNLVDAAAAAREIASVETHLPRAEWVVSAPAPVATREFSRLIFSDARFSYQTKKNATPFSVGPVNLTINAGDTVFITGVNGTGKSTFLHMLLALYPLSGGSLILDSEQVTAENVQQYYSLFSVVFPDIHLSHDILGSANIDLVFAQELLELFEMTGKVSIENGRFSDIALSHGQKKRLALIAALLEKRPILVLDEWAADQAPAFRALFYNKIIPWLKSRDITVIAITHDDAYFDLADMQIEIDNGAIRQINKKTTLSLPKGTG